MEIGKVAVLGAGVMGSGIAAHVANAGVPVLLLDIVPEGANDRNAVAAGAVARMLKADPAPFMHRDAARRVTVGNLEDDLDKLADCDWIVEAVVERLDVKRGLYEKVDAVRRAGSVVSSNTSTIPLSALTEGLSERFAGDFLVTHFFNPPRYMRLLEVVPGAKTRDEVLAAVTDFADRRLGKGVVRCKDEPGFIGNRIGVYWLQCAILEAIDAGLDVEVADAVMGRPAGIPKTGVFGLADLVGIDLVPHLLRSFDLTLPADDPFREYARMPALIERMIADGYTGRKGKGGFYRLQKVDGRREKQAIDLASGEYRAATKPEPACVAAAKRGGLRAMVTHDSDAGRYAWRVLSRTLAYAASLVPTIAEDVAAVDEAMRLGYGWKSGPFELIDQLGAAWLAERLAADGRPVPPLLATAGDGRFHRVHEARREFLGVDGSYHALRRAPGVVLLGDEKLKRERVAGNPAASLWDVGERVRCLEFHSKMNSLEAGTLEMIGTALKTVPAGGWAGLVIHNEGSNFSVGANLGLVLFAANMAAFEQIEPMVEHGQMTLKALKYAPFPVVGAPSGMALGGGLEILLHCDAIQAHAETYAGLVETGVGLVPAWGGCKEMLRRWTEFPQLPRGPMPPVMKVFETVSVATVAKSANEARDHLFLRPADRITMNRDRLLADARDRVLALADGYAPPPAPVFNLPGRSGHAALMLAVAGYRRTGLATPYDEVVASALADVLTGGDADVMDDLTEDDLLRLERRAFMSLLRREQTLARMEHMLETGKPLRN